jgi:septal ring factor EnvC (AmiA/AmiB activator)
MMNTDERLARVEEAILILTRLAQGLDERMDTHLTWINSLGEAQANSDAKIAALTNAQIKTEEVLARLGEAQSHTDQRLNALVSHTDQRLNALADAQIRTEEALARLAAAQAQAEARLAAAQAHTDQRLDALIDIVREGRNGKSET